MADDDGVQLPCVRPTVLLFPAACWAQTVPLSHPGPPLRPPGGPCASLSRACQWSLPCCQTKLLSRYNPPLLRPLLLLCCPELINVALGNVLRAAGRMTTSWRSSICSWTCCSRIESVLFNLSAVKSTFPRRHCDPCASLQDLCERHEKGVLHEHQRALHKYSVMKRQMMSATVQPKEQASVEQLESRIVQVVLRPSRDPLQLLLLFSWPVFHSLSPLNKHSEELALV